MTTMRRKGREEEFFLGGGSRGGQFALAGFGTLALGAGNLGAAQQLGQLLGGGLGRHRRQQRIGIQTLQEAADLPHDVAAQEVDQRIAVRRP